MNLGACYRVSFPLPRSTCSPIAYYSLSLVGLLHWCQFPAMPCVMWPLTWRVASSFHSPVVNVLVRITQSSHNFMWLVRNSSITGLSYKESHVWLSWPIPLHHTCKWWWKGPNYTMIRTYKPTRCLGSMRCFY